MRAIKKLWLRVKPKILNVIFMSKRLLICSLFTHDWSFFYNDRNARGDTLSRTETCKRCKLAHVLAPDAEGYFDTHITGERRQVKHVFAVFDRFVVPPRAVPSDMMVSGKPNQELEEVPKDNRVVHMSDYLRFKPTAPTPDIFKDVVAAGLFDKRAILNGVSVSCGLIAMRDSSELWIYTYPVVSSNPTVVISPTSMRIDGDNGAMSDEDIRHVLNKLLAHLRKQNLHNDKENVNG